MQALLGSFATDFVHRELQFGHESRFAEGLLELAEQVCGLGDIHIACDEVVVEVNDGDNIEYTNWT